MENEFHILCLPTDVIRAVVRKLTTQTVLALRGTCSLFRRMAPIEAMLPGLGADTLSWTVRGSSVGWDERLDTPDLRVRFRHLPIMVDVGSVNLVDARESSGCGYATSGEFSYRVDCASGNLFVGRTKGPDELVDAFVAQFRWPRSSDYIMYSAAPDNTEITVATRSKNVFVLQVKDTVAEMMAEYERVLTGPPVATLESRNFPVEMHWFNRVKICLYQGRDLWVLTHNERHDLAVPGAGTVVRVHSGVFEYVCTGVENMYVLDDVLVLLKANGTMWVRTSDGKLRRIMAFGEARIAAFAITPELSCLWVRFDDGSFIRHGAPFLLPVGGVRDECTQTVALLRARLARAERRIELLAK